MDPGSIFPDFYNNNTSVSMPDDSLSGFLMAQADAPVFPGGGPNVPSASTGTATSIPDLTLFAAGRLTSQQLLASGNVDFRRLLTAAQQLTVEKSALLREKDELRMSLMRTEGQRDLLQTMLDQVQATGAPLKLAPWERPCVRLPELDATLFPEVFNWTSNKTSDRGTSTGTEASIISEGTNGSASTSTGLGRGQHSHKRTDASGKPHDGPSKYLINEDGTGISELQKKQLSDKFTALCFSLRDAGKAPAKWGNISDAIAVYFYRTLEDEFEFLRYCYGQWKVKKYCSNRYSQFAQSHVRGRVKHERSDSTEDFSSLAQKRTKDEDDDDVPDLVPGPEFTFGTPAPSSPSQTPSAQVSGGAPTLTTEITADSQPVPAPTTGGSTSLIGDVITNADTANCMSTTAPATSIATTEGGPGAPGSNTDTGMQELQVSVSGAGAAVTPGKNAPVPTSEALAGQADSPLPFDANFFAGVDYDLAPSQPVELPTPAQNQSPAGAGSSSKSKVDRNAVYEPPTGGNHNKTVCGRWWKTKNPKGTCGEWEDKWADTPDARKKTWAQEIREAAKAAAKAKAKAAKDAAKPKPKPKPKKAAAASAS
ncbi:hypothetical protein PENSPDRAFT_682053 [Peniophora sp. CONT]|nr:hypothetical protein PENSPDRAFT_682053 [Peniophora sp. CONT]